MTLEKKLLAALGEATRLLAEVREATCHEAIDPGHAEVCRQTIELAWRAQILSNEIRHDVQRTLERARDMELS